MPDDVLVEDRDGIVILTLNRPAKFNAFDVGFVRAIRDAFEANVRRHGAEGIVLTGAGKAFCAGGDVAAMRDALASNPQRLFEDLTEHLHPIVAGIRKAPKPIVAAVNGPVAGGGFGLALACDLRVASRTASFKPAYRRLGIVPDGGLTYFLPRLAGVGIAQRIIWRDESTSAEEALRLGLVDSVVEPEAVVEEAWKAARDLADQPAESFRLTKELLNASAMAALETQLERERRRNASSAKGPWLREGVNAFLEKRRPNFRRDASEAPR